jgi:hypothetical protein
MDLWLDFLFILSRATHASSKLVMKQEVRNQETARYRNLAKGIVELGAHAF